MNKGTVAAIVFALAAGIGGVTSTHAVTFYFNGYGGFTDPGQVTPTSPADGFDTGTTVDFVQPYGFLHQSTFDTDITAWQAFGWETTTADHSHLSINELTPALPPATSTFADPVSGAVTANDDAGAAVGWLIHHNEVISNWFGPDNLALHYHVDIYADAAKTIPVFASGPMAFTFSVMETINAGVGGVCFDNNGGQTGADTGFSPPCPDRFRLAEGWPADPNSGGPFNHGVGTFVHKGTLYRVSLSGFWDDGNLIGEAWSQEGTHNQFNIRVRVVSVPTTSAIPALSQVGLLLLALAVAIAGFMILRRRELS